MIEMKDLEMELRSWQPRRPSARLEQSLFGEHRPEPAAVKVTLNAQPALPFRLSWLAPAAAALMLICALFNPRNTSTLSSSASAGPMVALMMSNQSAAA